MSISDAITLGQPADEADQRGWCSLRRIGTVIRDVYRRPGADAVPAHLEDRYGIIVDKATQLAPGVYRVDRQDGPAWVARHELRDLDRPAVQLRHRFRMCASFRWDAARIAALAASAREAAHEL